MIAALHDAMLYHAKPTPPGRLGPVGGEHFKTLLHSEYGVRRFWYKTTALTVGGVPWIVEVAVADTVEPGRIWFGCNHGPAFGDPLGRTWLAAGEVCGYGAESFLTDSCCGNGNRAAVVHVICAATQFVDKGKVALVIPSSVAAAASKALGGATKTLRAEAEQRRKDAARADRAARRARDEADRWARARRWSIKEAVFEVLPDAKTAAGDVVAARTLFYKVRPLIQQFTDAELDYAYFSQTLLPEYERTIAPLHGLYYEPRGELHHPHDDAVIPLGTREVEDYTPPSWQFDKVLYIEKAGLQAQLAPYEISRRYDMAVIYGKGYSPTACRNLLARSEIRAMKLFVVHDADLDGYTSPAPSRKQPADAVSQRRRRRSGFDRAPGHRIRVGDRGVHPPRRSCPPACDSTRARPNGSPASR